MDFDIQVAHSVQEIGQEVWEHLGQGKPFTSYRWYRFGETVLIDDAPIYIILSLGDEPVARATFWLKRQEPLEISPEIVHRLTQTALRYWPLLVCRSPLYSTSGLILPGDPQLRNAALETIARVAQDQARRYRASLLFFDYLERHETEWSVWSDVFMPVTIPEPGTRLMITWPDFESYLKHLSKSERKRYRRNCRRVAKLGVEIKLHRTVTAVNEAMALIQNHDKQYHASPVYWARRLLENVAMVDAVWLVAETKDRLVGCELMLGDGGVWYATGLGRDYDFPYVYFVLGYEGIRYAIENGAEVLRWGSGAYDVKQRLGFQLESNNHLTVAVNNRVLRWIVRRLTAG